MRLVMCWFSYLCYLAFSYSIFYKFILQVHFLFLNLFHIKIHIQYFIIASDPRIYFLRSDWDFLTGYNPRVIISSISPSLMRFENAWVRIFHSSHQHLFGDHTRGVFLLFGSFILFYFSILLFNNFSYPTTTKLKVSSS
jgi:hypothetical protein